MTTSREALATRADVAIVLLATHAKALDEAAAAGGGGEARDGELRRNPDGTMTQRITSMGSFAAALGRLQPPRVGRPT